MSHPPTPADPAPQGMSRERIDITGIVQGVGFRPHIHRLALRHGLTGWVINTPGGVTIEAAGNRDSLDAFVRAISGEAPPLAHITGIVRAPSVETADSLPGGFSIRDSVTTGIISALISPDTALCPDCRGELFDPADRRYLHPFITCTNCGPRYTIITGLPYDRPLTTMAGFPLCPECQREYDDPYDRRYHAQPVACPQCGPRLALLDATGQPIPGDPIPEAIALLRRGAILAIKGLGGFHLAVRADDEDAVRRLRERKHREEKPLAVMAASMASARRLVDISAVEEALLAGRERPILLSRRRQDAPIALSVAPGNDLLGVMLPYTPLHELVFFHPAAGGDAAGDIPTLDALVMTSGNQTDEPICCGNDEALERLGGIADAFLLHDRGIRVRNDDSVMTVAGGEPVFLRRSRGWVPAPVVLSKEAPPILAVGGELKNALCVTVGRHAFLSQHLGDLEHPLAKEVFRETVAHFARVLDIHPEIVAFDLHPGYHATSLAREYAAHNNIRASIGIQHHHAHIAGVMAEHGHRGPVIGFALDGTGYGSDGSIWGGEILIADGCGFVRLGHVVTTPLPGGDSAARECWRMGISWLRSALGPDWLGLDLPFLADIHSETRTLIDRACAAGVNSPPTSSLGRLFDAVAAILDIRRVSAYEGQAAMLLELAARQVPPGDPLPWAMTVDSVRPTIHRPEITGIGSPTPTMAPCPSSGFLLDFRPTVIALMEGVKRGTPAPVLARAFHDTLLAAFVKSALRTRDLTGIGTVALSGGCWQNRILAVECPPLLRQEGFQVLTHRLVPPNDGGLALGQASVAACITTPD